MIYVGEIVRAKFSEDKSILQIKIDKNILEILRRNKTKYIEVSIPDSRLINHEQRKKIYATINDIATYTGDVPERIKEFFKYRLMELEGVEYFSLKDCSVTVAREYLNLIIDFVIEWGIPLRDAGVNRTDDIERYLYKCIQTRTCAITGRKNADIHHVIGSRVGTGRNRRKMNHVGMRLIALSREWHNKVHQEGEAEIFEKYKIHGIYVDSHTLKELGLNAEEID